MIVCVGLSHGAVERGKKGSPEEGMMAGRTHTARVILPVYVQY